MDQRQLSETVPFGEQAQVPEAVFLSPQTLEGQVPPTHKKLGPLDSKT